MITVFVQDLPVQLKSWHDLDFIHSFGRVFRVFDHLISGNLCFGVENEQGRFFIKYAGAPTINYGLFINTVIDFLIVAFAIYLMIVQVNRFSKKPEAAPPATKECPFCISAVPIKATRCPNCTSNLE